MIFIIRIGVPSAGHEPIADLGRSQNPGPLQPDRFGPGRSGSGGGPVPPFDIKMVRRTPAIVANTPGQTDFFCLGDPDAATAGGWQVVSVHDGWYADDGSGGMAIWGQGRFWEVRDTPFTIRQACGPEAWPANWSHDPDTEVNVRQAIFRG